jgi:hypothetical protein
MTPRILVVTLCALATACGGSGAVAVGPASDSGGASGLASIASSSGSASAPATASGGSSTAMPIEVWLAREGVLWPVRRSVKPTLAVLGASVTSLLAGPTSSERADGVTSAVPAGTQLLGISLHGRVATVDLTSEFGNGSPADERLRLAQLVYTVTGYPNVRGMLLRLNGQPVSAFSDGLVLPDPITRSSMGFPDLVPPITVVRPAAGAAVRAPLTVSGIADVFEATLRFRLLDASGHELSSGESSSSCGTGCPGTFTFSVDELGISRDQTGTLIVSGGNASGLPGRGASVRVPLRMIAPYDVSTPADGATITSPAVVSFRHPASSRVLVRVFDSHFRVLGRKSVQASCFGRCSSVRYTARVPFEAAELQTGYIVLSPDRPRGDDSSLVVEIPVTLNAG